MKQQPQGGLMHSMGLKIKKSPRGTYHIPSLSIKKLRELAKMGKHRWTLSKDEKSLYIEAE